MICASAFGQHQAGRPAVQARSVRVVWTLSLRKATALLAVSAQAREPSIAANAVSMRVSVCLCYHLLPHKVHEGGSADRWARSLFRAVRSVVQGERVAWWAESTREPKAQGLHRSLNPAKILHLLVPTQRHRKKEPQPSRGGAAPDGRS